MTASEVNYIYKIVPASAPPPDPLPHRLPVSKLDSDDRFIHLSTSIQVSRTLNKFFGNDSSVYLLRIPYIRVVENIKWEGLDGAVGTPGEEGKFPHLRNDDGQGLKLGRDEVESVKEVVKGAGEDTWDSALNAIEQAGWLVY
ncbi:hypothetical protein BJ138DRAFT_1146033 [Hygrophoropsis aurantiaca]|uniref:Uncharacterized protein n=1 Tax=Hygrophoropsis aurantiaca TaxID=72124 RepID=A0ACB8AKD2_9AGAM|nr:hypothetical protein BJ138DRAFT_1146033 [Hygrophoropsis aurantiaca]